MSQNDYTIANQAFPAFRADLNSALQAIATNNSGTTAPSTMFANMWWYDSANNILYIRNEDNDAWIKFAELDQTNDKFILSGTLQLDDGSASAPALTFNSDTNMGLYRGGTDILKFVTAGADAVTIDASQNVGIGVVPEAWQSTRSALQVGDSTAVWGDGSKNSWFTNNVYRNSSNNEVYINASYASEITMTNGGIINFKVAPSGSADATIGWTTAMTIDNSGNVGIGTSSPAGKLSISNGTIFVGSEANTTQTNNLLNGYGYRIGATLYGSVGIRSSYNSGTNQASLDFYTEATERMRIDSSGNVLVGTTSTLSSAKVTIKTPDGSGAQIPMCIAVGLVSDGFGGISFRNPDGVQGTIAINSTSVTYNTSSDYRLKENVVTEWDATTRLKQLKPSRFNFIADADTTVDGFLAHEVSSIVPEAITGTKDAVDADGKPDYQGIDQSKLVPLLVKTIQELEARITALEGA